jgi:hypothetical protein
MPTLEEYLNGVQQRQQKTAILESNLGEAANTNPDEFASMVKLSRAAKISVDAVPEYQDLAKSTELLKKTNVPGLVDTHPQTSKFLADPDKAKLASDDIDNFKATESVFGKIGQFFSDTGGVIKSGTLSASAGVVGVVRAPIDLLNDVAGVILPVRPFTPLTDALAEYQQGITKAAQYAMPKAETDVGKGIVSGGASLVRNTLNLPLLFAGPQGQRAYWAATLAPVAGEEYGKGKEKGLSTAQAINYAGTQTGIEYLTEKIPMGKLVGDLKAGSPFYKTLYNQLITEIPGEQAATVLQDLTEWATLNPEKPFKTYLEERPSAALQTLVATTVGVGGSTVISTSLEKATNAYAAKADQAERGEKIADVIANMNKLSAANKVRTRDAETFEEWISQVSEDSPIQNVYINAETLKQSGMDKQLQEIAPEIAEQVETAAAMGRDVQIPIADYMTKIAPTPLGDAMLDDLRAEGETMTRKEAREFIDKKSEELQAAADQMMQQKENDQKFIDSAKQVETTMFDQLKATGVYTSTASKNFATYVRDIYVTKAAAMGITPGELYNMIPYKITANMPAATVQLFSQDGKVKTETDAFKAFYGNSVFKTEQGAPVTLYHGTADDVTQFDVDHPNRKDSGWLGTGVYLTDSTDMAEIYAMQKKRTGQAGENVMPLYARLENPYYATAEDKSRVRAGGRAAADQFTTDLQAQGYDGVIYQVAPDAKEIVVFDPAAVKSQFNDGTWSNENNLLAQKEKTKGDVTQHVLMAERGERTTGKVARISDGEKSIIDAAAKKLGIKSTEILNMVKNHKLANPPKDGWAPLELTGVKIEAGKNGKPGKYELQYQVVPYTFANGANGKIMKKDTPEYDKRVKAIAKRIHDEVLGVFDRAQAGDKAAQNIIRQAGWYKEMRSRLRQEFGGLGDVFADLLGATSPNTPVRENWKNAVDVLRRATRGDFDELMPKWVEWSTKVDQAEMEFGAWFGQQIEAGLTKKAITSMPEYAERMTKLTELRKIDDSLLPVKESGKKYGFNGRNALRALIDLWRVVKDPNADLAIGGTAPKALNFSGNLIGFRERATIDVWAARLLQRLSGGVRIPSMAESGVSGNMLSSGETTLQFGFGQDVFTEAVKEIRADKQMQAEDRLANINDDDLQAVVWFLEKEVWTKNNWTSAAGEGGSFEYEADLTGQRDLEELTRLRKIMDSSKSTPEQKAAAAEELNRMARTVDRFTGGLSIQQSTGTQGIDFVPTDADMARLGDAIKTSIYEQDDGATVLGSKSLSTEGRYGDPERSLDLEVIAREGFNPLPMWRKMLEAARDANQDSTFLSRVLRHDEQVDYQRHRPGVEIYFREAGSIDKLQPILDDLAAKGVQFYTVIVDGKRNPDAMAGAMPNAVGVRLQYVPEMNARYGMDAFNWADLTVEEISTKMEEQAIAMQDLAATVAGQVEGVSFAGQFWYETEVAFKNQYQEKIDAITSRTTTGSRSKAGAAAWSGQSVREGVEGANRWARESEQQAGTEVQPGGELLAQRAAPTTDERTGLDLNPDGTVTLYHHTSAESAGAIKRSGQLVSAGEPSVYLTTRRETDTGYGDTVVTVRVNPDRLNIDDEFPNGRQDFRIDVGQPGGAVQVLTGDYQSILNQPARGGFDPKSLTTILTKESDYSTFIHETTHFYLDMLTRLAEMPNAPQQFKDDLTAVLEWSGATPEEWAAWNQEFRDTGKMNEGMRKVHEAFAYNSEIYIATGNAPSLKMQTMFDQFAAWLRRVYKSIRDELNVIYRQEHGEDLPILTGEVRQVMDRMLASEEQIVQAQTVRGMSPFYQTQEASGMDDATWAAYQAMAKEAQDQSVSDLTAASLRQMRWLSNAKSRIFKEMQKQNAEIRKDVRAQVAKEIEQQPIYRALRLIKFGEEMLPDGTTMKLEENTKLSVSGMEELYMGEGDKYALLDWSSLGYGKYGMLSEDGMHPDALAERVGYSSGDELVRSLLNAKSLKEAVEQKTDQRMLEEYGDLSDQRSMDLAVERALHNEARARFVAAELRHAAKATQPVRVMLAAARQAARRIIGNKLVRDTKVSEYSAAETRATRAAEKAMKEGKPEEVTKQLQNRLLNNQLTAEATKATQEVDKGLRYLKSMQTDQSRKRVGADYSDQVDQLLSRFDLNNRTLKAIDAQTSLLEWMKSQEDAGYQPEISLTMQNDAYRKNYKNMTVDEFRDLVDAVKQIEHMGRTEQNMLTAAKETAYREARDQIVDSINTNANGRKVDARTPTTEMGRRLQGMKRFFAAHLKAANVALILDGGKEGAMWEYFIRTANKRGDQETEMRAKATERLTEIFAPVFKLGRMGGAGLSFPTIGRSLNREARLAIGLNMGNEGNIQRLLDGEGWTREQIQPVLDSLTAQEWQAIQQVWDYFESYRPAIAEKERRIYGKEPKWIDPKPLTVNVGNGNTLELRGGYYPVKYDPQATIQAETGDEKEAAKRQLQGAFTSATTRRSFTKARVEKVVGRPLIYTLAGMYSGINDVIHDLAWHEWLIDANKLLRSQSIDQAIRTQYGPEFKQQLKTWVQDVAAGEQAVQNEGEIALNYLRQSISAAGLGFNVMSAIQQITGFNQSIVKVGARYIGRGIAQTISGPRDAMKMVSEKSSFMENRARTQFRELNELRNMVQDESAAMRQVKLGAYFMMSKMQRMVDVPTWIGAYEKAIGEGNDESRSIALADQAVIDSQGGGMLKDLSRVERGGAGLKLFTVYYSYMNTVFNLATVKTMTAKSKGRLAADYAMLFVVPVVLTTALKQALTPGGDDEWDMEKLARKLAAEQLSYLMGTMIILREFGQAGQIMFGNDKARDYSGPAGLRVVADSVSFLKQASQLEFDDSFRKAAINLLGDLTGLPSAQINRTITGTKALAEGKTDNPAAIVLGNEK